MIFLLANTSIKIDLEILFLTFSDTNIWFAEKKLTWKSYKTTKALLITRKVELINKKEFAIAAIYKNSKIFVIYIASIIKTMLIHLFKKTQIVVLKVNKALIKVLAKYLDYVDVFSPNLAMKLFKYK